MATVNDIFSQLGLPKWWLPQNITQRFGANGEKGQDYGLGGFGKPVGSITTGKVVYVGNGGYPGSSIGQIVQVLTPSGQLLHYQHLMSSSVSVGQPVQVGTVLGKGGGCMSGAYPPGLVGNGCTHYDNFSTGQHIEVRYAPNYRSTGGVWSQNWINPASIFLQIAGGSAVAPPPGLNSPFPGTINFRQPAKQQTPASQQPLPSSFVNSFSVLGQRIMLVLISLVFIAMGFFLLMGKQLKGGAKKAMKAVVLA